MLKIHNKTNLNYLCITKQENWESYPGSGTYWTKHLKKHGYDFRTKLLFSSDDYLEFIRVCEEYSNLFDVVKSQKFANLVPEIGYQSGVSNNNLVLWWNFASEEEKEIIYKKRSEVMIQYHKNLSEEEREIISLKRSTKNKEMWEGLTLEEKRNRTEYMRSFQKYFFLNKETKKYKDYVQKQSENVKKYYRQFTEQEISEILRQRRLNLSSEKREIRKKKIQEVYNTGKHDHLFKRMSNERQGINNPAAKKIVWYGIEFTKSQFKTYIKTQSNLNFDTAMKIINDPENHECYKTYSDEQKEYPKIICPYCLKESINKPSSFKRWHFDNCKENK